MKIGLIGIGSIGTYLVEQINHRGVFPGVRVEAVFDERPNAGERVRKFAEIYEIQAFTHLGKFLAADIDFVIECATVEAVRQYARSILQKKDLLIISVGALKDLALLKELEKACEASKHRMYLPSGAIGGLDVLKAANVLGGLKKVQITTRKPAHTLVDEPLVKEQIIFQGSAEDVIEKYPRNTNITIIVSLATLGTRRTEVKLIADPTLSTNIHQIDAEGDFGKLSLRVENFPMPTNPKSSYLTSLSILQSIQSIGQNLRIGS